MASKKRAKKSLSKPNAGRTNTAAFDAAEVAEPRYRVSFNYNELMHARAASLVAPRLQTTLLALSMTALFGVVALLMLDKKTLPIVLPLVVFTVVVSPIITNQQRIKAWYLNRTNLHISAPSIPHHISVNDTELIDHISGQEPQRFSLSSIKHVESSDSAALIRFGAKTYVFIPRESINQLRFDELILLLEKRGR